MLICALPVTAACDGEIADSLYKTYIENGDMGDFWTVLAAASLGIDVDAKTEMSENASALDIASALLMERASGRDGKAYETALLGCLHDNGSIHNGNDTIDEEIGQYATTQALAMIALEVSHADYDRASAVSYLFSQQCENGGLGFYEYDDVTTSCWGMIAYLMSGAAADEAKISALMGYIESSLINNVVYEYDAPNLWSTAAYIALLEVQGSQAVFDVYDAFIENFYNNGSFDTEYQPAQGVLGVGCFARGCVFINLRDGGTSAVQGVGSVIRSIAPYINGNDAIKRADCITTIMKLIGVDEDDAYKQAWWVARFQSEFDDIGIDEYNAQKGYIIIAKLCHVAVGITHEKHIIASFEPGRDITIKECLTAMLRCLMAYDTVEWDSIVAQAEEIGLLTSDEAQSLNVNEALTGGMFKTLLERMLNMKRYLYWPDDPNKQYYERHAGIDETGSIKYIDWVLDRQ